MIYEIQREDFAKVRSLISWTTDEAYTVINSVLNSNTRGRVFVDNLQQPRSALVWAVYCMFYFVGDGQNEAFMRDLSSFFSDTLGPLNAELGCDTFIATLLVKHGWEGALDSVLEGKNYEKGLRQGFTFNSERFLSTSIQEQLPTCCSIQRVTASDKHAPGREELVENILEFWDCFEDFLDRGLGYYLLKDNEVISSCLSCGVSGRKHEIVINTYSDEHRGKGYGQAVARAYLSHCVEHGLTPRWEAFDTNYASLHLASTLGFEDSGGYTYYEFLFADLK